VERTAPHAFVFPAEQRDPGAAKKLLETLAYGQVEIDRATRPFTAGGKHYSAGSYVIGMQQPYSSYAKTLLEKQAYPDLRQYPGGPPKQPYDVTAHTLPMLMGVAVDTIPQPFTRALIRTERYDFTSRATQTFLPAADTATWRNLNAALRSNKPVWRDPVTGDFHMAEKPAGDMKSIHAPRIALYKSWAPSMDEGWTRWLLEQFGFAYTNVTNRDLQAGNLRDRFDAIVFPDQRAELIYQGHKPGAMPEEYTGGVGDGGAEALKQFASKGGVVVFFNDASEFALKHMGLGVKDVLSGVANRDFYAPGSLLNVRLEQHPITLGLPREIPVWFESGPAFEATGRDRAIAVYPDQNILASGWLLGEKHLAKRAAVVDVPVGSGHVMLFGIRPQYRAQSYLTFKLFFNSLFYFE
jgi:hypothetical protein